MLILLLLVLQLVLPLGLLAWLAWSPLKSVVGLWIQILSAGVLLLAVAWSGMWIVPPWWTPYLLGVAWGAIVILGARRHASRPFWPRAWLEWASLAVLVPLGGYAGLVASDAYAGRTPSAGVVELTSPLRGGPYLVVNGGSTGSVNTHVRTLDLTDDRTTAHRGQSFAVDVVKLDAFGLRARGLRPRDPSAYHIFGEALYAPCDGVVIHAEDDRPDLPVPETDIVHMPGNHVLLRCGETVVLMAHMRRRSVAVSAGDRVTTGQMLAVVGNSGNTAEPHLHIHAQRVGPPDAPLSGKPLPIRIGGRFLVRNDRFEAPDR